MKSSLTNELYNRFYVIAYERFLNTLISEEGKVYERPFWTFELLSRRRKDLPADDITSDDINSCNFPGKIKTLPGAKFSDAKYKY